MIITIVISNILFNALTIIINLFCIIIIIIYIYIIIIIYIIEILVRSEEHTSELQSQNAIS